MNLYATGVPFGLRGTFVAIHNNSGFVEAIFDEEFLGGRGLQGSCSQFRGRLCAWAALLRVSQPPVKPQSTATHPKQIAHNTHNTHSTQDTHTQHTQPTPPTYGQGRGVPRHDAEAKSTAAMMSAAANASAEQAGTPQEQQAAASAILLSMIRGKGPPPPAAPAPPASRYVTMTDNDNNVLGPARITRRDWLKPPVESRLVIRAGASTRCTQFHHKVL